MSTLGARRLLWANRLPLPTLDLNFLAASPAFVGAWPLDGRIAFTRATTGPATYFDSTGTLRTARQNVLLNSGNLSSFAAATNSTVATAATTAPDGTLTGTSLTEDATASASHYRDYIYTPPGSSAITFSIYMKNGTRRYASLELRVAGTWVGGVAVVFVDLQLGTITSTSGTVTGSITTVGNGWYRVSATATTTASPGATNFRIGLCNPANTNSYNGDGVSLNYFWGAQIEVAGTLGDYIPTGAAANSAPRFDFDPVTLAPRALLIEESRSNITTNSQAINSWPTKTDTTITDNSTTSPDGTVNASICTEGVAGTAQIVSNAPTVSAGSTLSYTLFLKRGNTDFVRVLCVDNGATNGAQFWVNTATGVISGEANRGTATSRTVTITPLPNSWFRVVCQITMPGTSTTAVFLVTSASASGSTTRVNNATYYLWGAQCEVGSFSTSYIATGASAATRPADIATMPFVVPLLSGTIAAEITYGQTQANNQVAFQLDDGSANNRVIQFLVGGGSNNISTIQTIGGAGATAAGGTPAVGASTITKSAAAFGNLAVSTTLNGVAPISAVTTGGTGSSTTLRFGVNQTGASPLDGYIRRVRYWPQILRAAQLQQVTK